MSILWTKALCVLWGAATGLYAAHLFGLDYVVAVVGVGGVFFFVLSLAYWWGKQRR